MALIVFAVTVFSIVAPVTLKLPLTVKPLTDWKVALYGVPLLSKIVNVLINGVYVNALIPFISTESTKTKPEVVPERILPSKLDTP